MEDDTSKTRAIVSFIMAGLAILIAIFILSYTMGSDEETPSESLPTTAS